MNRIGYLNLDDGFAGYDYEWPTAIADYSVVKKDLTKRSYESRIGRVKTKTTSYTLSRAKSKHGFTAKVYALPTKSLDAKVAT